MQARGSNSRARRALKERIIFPKERGIKKKKWDNRYTPHYPLLTTHNETRERIYITHEKTVPFWRIELMN